MKKLLFIMLLTTFCVVSYASDIYRVASERVNVRTNPSAKSKIIGYVLYGENVQVIDSTNVRWYKIKVTNLTGYVNSSLLNKVAVVDFQAKKRWYNLKVFGITSLFVLLVVGIYCLFRIPSKEKEAFISDNSNYDQQIIIKRKSVGVAILLTFFFGPLGMFYSTIKGAIVMLLLPLVGALFFIFSVHQNSNELMIVALAGFIILGSLYWLICIIWAAIAAGNSNKIFIQVRDHTVNN